jgi:hypothetical protein
VVWPFNSKERLDKLSVHHLQCVNPSPVDCTVLRSLWRGLRYVEVQNVRVFGLPNLSASYLLLWLCLLYDVVKKTHPVCQLYFFPSPDGRTCRLIGSVRQKGGVRMTHQIRQSAVSLSPPPLLSFTPSFGLHHVPIWLHLMTSTIYIWLSHVNMGASRCPGFRSDNRIKCCHPELWVTTLRFEWACLLKLIPADFKRHDSDITSSRVRRQVFRFSAKVLRCGCHPAVARFGVRQEQLPDVDRLTA